MTLNLMKVKRLLKELLTIDVNESSIAHGYIHFL